MSRVNSENPVAYAVSPDRGSEDAIITQALRILESRFKTSEVVFDSPESVRAYCRLHFGGLEHEEFGVLFLNSQNRLIEFVSMFRGTVGQASVYPREVVKHALRVNASAVIFTHNHPSGFCEPSRADEHLTVTLKAALALVDVRILDHIIVSAIASVSMAERGLV